MSKYSFDIVIVGRGFVGTALALLLRDLPLNIAILDRLPEFSNTSDFRSIVLSYGSYLILDRLGLGDFIKNHAVPIYTIQVSDAGHFGMTHVSSVEEGVPALAYVIEGGVLQRVLETSLKTASSLTFFYDSQIISLIELEQAHQITIEHQGKHKILKTDLLVGADGTDSIIRKLKKVKTKEFDYEQTAIVSKINLNRAHEFISYERFTSEGSIAFLPLSGLQSGLVWSAPSVLAAEILSLPDELFLQRLQKQFGYRLGKFRGVRQRITYPLKSSSACLQGGKGWILVGNAAHTLHPIAAQGFNLGLRDVSFLSEVICDGLSLNKKLYENDLIARYSAGREGNQEKTQRFTHYLVSLFSQTYWPMKLARNGVSALIEYFPPLKHRIAKHAMGIS
ncbi:MAG: hypothetical protein A3I12_04730 [Gammaproteobacteria bacterium RIFCSPLOWO2_02_FULL_38_11]|nr:MAG: hypothetical protein A3I12_04730 [Gammaproteobacteria bacterium RIFCSPLOWO2_02_FULL_38_11]